MPASSRTTASAAAYRLHHQAAVFSGRTAPLSPACSVPSAAADAQKGAAKDTARQSQAASRRMIRNPCKVIPPFPISKQRIYIKL